MRSLDHSGIQSGSVRMRGVRILSSVLLVLALCWQGLPARAAVPAPADTTVVLRDDQDVYLLGEKMLVLEDPSTSLTFGEVSSGRFDDRFSKPNRLSPGYGFSPSAFWVMVILDGSAHRPSQWFLELDYSPMQYIDVYQQGPDGTVTHQKGGSSLHFEDRPYFYHNHVFELAVPREGTTRLYVRFAGENSKNMPLRLLTGEAFPKAASAKMYVFGAYTGVIVALFFYNLIVWYSARQPSYAYYLGFLVSFLCFVLSLHGMLQQFVVFDNPAVAIRIIPFFMGLAAFFCIQFARHFLRPDTLGSGIPRAFSMFLGIILLSVAGAFLLPYRWAVILSAVLGVGLAFFLVFTASYAVSKGLASAKFYLSAWLMLIVGMIVNPLRLFSIIPNNVFTEYIMLWGSAAEAILLSVALAAHIKSLRVEKDSALQQAAAQEKMANLGMLSAGVAHEINNPNNYMRLSADTLGAKVADLREFVNDLLDDDSEEIRAEFETRFKAMESQVDLVREGSRRIADIVQGMRASSRKDEEKGLFDPVAGLAATTEIVKANYKTVATFDLRGLVARGQVEGHASQMNQVFTNLMVNGCQAIEEKLRQSGRQEPGEIRLTSTLEGEWLRMSVTDSGTGMPEHVKNRLFEPFFTTKGSERGTGLGMGICKGIMESHGGRLEVESMPGVGTTITVVLPLYQA
jgi:two-component system NtrC family sensor kinase